MANGAGVIPSIRPQRSVPAITFVFALALISWCLTTACGKKGDPVRHTLDAIVAAAEKGSADGVLAGIAADYKDAEGNGRADIELTLRRYLAAYESLAVRLSDVEIERSSSAARVRFRADFSGVPRKLGGLDAWLPRSSSWRFEVRLSPEKGEWKVYWASWSPAQ